MKKIKTSNGTTGWVSGQYLTSGVVNQPSTDNSTSQSSYKATVNATSLNVRSGASTSYSVITKLSKGTVVDVIGKCIKWMEENKNIKWNNRMGKWSILNKWCE